MAFQMRGICGTLWLDLEKEKWLNIHWESHLVHNIYLREVPLVIYQVENLRLNNRESMVLRYSLLVICKVEMYMVSFRDIHWERSSFLVHNV